MLVLHSSIGRRRCGGGTGGGAEGGGREEQPHPLTGGAQGRSGNTEHRRNGSEQRIKDL